MFVLLMITSCGKDKEGYWDAEEQKQQDHNLIKEYVAEKELDGVFTESGLYYVIEVTGGPVKPTLESKITADYIGYYLDGEKLDEGHLNDYYLGSLILGWQEGLQLIGINGKIKLIIPSHLAYGHNPSGGVRRDAVLMFDIHLIDFE